MSLLLTAGAIAIQDGKVLLVKRPKDKKVFPEFWAFPGGKLEELESLEDCMRREFTEETGGRVTSSQPYLFHEYNHAYNRVISHLYLVEVEQVTAVGKMFIRVHGISRNWKPTPIFCRSQVCCVFHFHISFFI